MAEREAPLCLLALGRTTPCRAEVAQAAPLELETVPLSMAERSYPDLVRMHQASELIRPDEVRAIDGAVTAGQEAGQDSGLDAPLSGVDCLGLGESHVRGGSTWHAQEASPPKYWRRFWMVKRPPRCDFPPLSDTYPIVNASAEVAPEPTIIHVHGAPWSY